MLCEKTYAIPSLLSCQLSVLMGAAIGYSAILLPQLNAPDSPIKISTDDASWIASSGIICRPIGVLVEGVIVDLLGRKTALQLVAFFFVLSWLFTGLSNSLTVLYLSRTFLSFTLGMTICVGLYIAEITTPQDRGTFLSLITPSMNLGLIAVYTLGSFYHWQNVAWILAAYSLIIFVFLNYIPESHIWYMLRKRQSEAVIVLQRLRKGCPSDNLNDELEEIRTRLNRHMRKNGGGGYWKNFTSPAAWKPFLIFTVFSLLQQQAGYNIIMYRAVEFFANLQQNSPQFDSNRLAIAFACISLAGSAILVTIVHKFNRITLLTFSGICMASMMTIAAIYRSIDSVKPINLVLVASPISFPVLCIFFYIFFCMLGMIDIPWMMIGEILPNHLRGVMSALITVVIFVVQFANVRSYQFMLNIANFGTTGILSVSAVFSCSSVIFAKIFFPETKDKALTEIEDLFDKDEYDRIHLKESRKIISRVKADDSGCS